MDVLSFTTLFPSPARPCHGLFVARRLAALAEEGVALRVVAPVPRPIALARLVTDYGIREEVPAQVSWRNLPVSHLRYPMAPGLGLLQAYLLASAAAGTVARLLAARRAALIDAHYLYPDGVAAARLARRFRLPLVLTARGSDVHHILRLPGYRGQILQALDQAAAIITVSRALRDAVIAAGAEASRVITIRNGVDSAFFRPGDRTAARAALGWPSDVPLLLAVGGLVAHKRHRLLLPLLGALPDARLVIIGEGPLRTRLRADAAAAGVADRLLLPGAWPPERLALAYRAADLLLHPSQREGIPNVVLEALASGLPVVAAPVGGIPEILPGEGGGRLVDPENAAVLLGAVEHLLAERPATQTVRATVAGLSWRSCARRVVARFEEVIDGRLSNPGG